MLNFKLVDSDTRKVSILEGHDPKVSFLIKEAKVNIPSEYNYKFIKIFGEKGLNIILGLTAQESIPMLQQACRLLNNDKIDTYWNSSEGCARLLLHNLISLAKLKPECIWEKEVKI